MIADQPDLTFVIDATRLRDDARAFTDPLTQAIAETVCWYHAL